MQTFVVYFEIYGKKMKAEVQAENEWDAMTKIKNKIVFHKVKPKLDEGFDYLMNIINNFKP